MAARSLCICQISFLAFLWRVFKRCHRITPIMLLLVIILAVPTIKQGWLEMQKSIWDGWKMFQAIRAYWWETIFVQILNSSPVSVSLWMGCVIKAYSELSSANGTVHEQFTSSVKFLVLQTHVGMVHHSGQILKSPQRTVVGGGFSLIVHERRCREFVARV